MYTDRVIADSATAPARATNEGVTAAVDELWTMAWRHRAIAPRRVLDIIPVAVRHPDLDERTQLLIRDALNAVAEKLGRDVTQILVDEMPEAKSVNAIWHAEYDKVGFPTLARRMQKPFSPNQLLGYLRELGRRLREPASITIAGSAVLILRAIVVRPTSDIDVIDELPRAIREEHELLKELEFETEVHLGHTASHYMPSGYQGRTTEYAHFDRLSIRMVDTIDLLVGKLFSMRPKDFRDVRDAWDNIDQAAFRDRLARCTHGLREVPRVGEKAKDNWYILTGEKDIPPLVASPA